MHAVKMNEYIRVRLKNLLSIWSCQSFIDMSLFNQESTFCFLKSHSSLFYVWTLKIYLSFDRSSCFEYVEYMKTLCNVILFQWQELIARKPKEGEEDPVLVEEIRKARENVGMYTRKTSLEYEETDPIRFETHKSQLVTLLTQVSILNIRKLVFNHNSQMWKF